MASMPPVVVDVVVDLVTHDQPECCKKLCEAGWRFEWQPEAGFVAAEHPLGGKQSIVEVLRIGRSGFDRNEIGERIAMLLNGGNHK